MSNPNEAGHDGASRTPLDFQDVLQQQAAIVDLPWCLLVPKTVDKVLRDRCAYKYNHLKPCGHEGHEPHPGHPGHASHEDCPCDPDADGPRRVDLVVLIDTRLEQTAPTLMAAIHKAVGVAADKCPSEFRVDRMVVDSTRPGTSGSAIPAFGPSHEQYLNGIGVAGPFAHDAPTGGSPGQQGADAINDISRYYNWRPGACRVVYYVSNAPLDAGPTQDPADQAARAAAVAQANANGVAVFAHLLTPVVGGNQPATQADYAALCGGTGGALTVGPPNPGVFVEGLAQALCHPCGQRCVEVPVPDVRPCISISWGDSPCDCMQTNDTEVLCITVCNCYSNVVLRDFTIGFVLVTAVGDKVPTLPDGTPSVDIRPLGPICFGDIPPCRDGRPGCVSREVVLIARGAKGGSYQVHLGGICYSVSFDYEKGKCFQLVLCQD